MSFLILSIFLSADFGCSSAGFRREETKGEKQIIKIPRTSSRSCALNTTKSSLVVANGNLGTSCILGAFVKGFSKKGQQWSSVEQVLMRSKRRTPQNAETMPKLDWGNGFSATPSQNPSFRCAPFRLPPLLSNPPSSKRLPSSQMLLCASLTHHQFLSVSPPCVRTRFALVEIFIHRAPSAHCVCSCNAIDEVGYLQ